MNKKIRENAITNKINNKYIIAAILIIGIVLVKTLVIKDSQKSSVSHIKRPEPGEASKNISLDVYDAAGNKQTTINTYVEPRKMSEEETQQCFDEAYDELLRIVLKNNASADYITQDICMTDKLAEGLISVSMYPSDYSVIDYDGTVHNELLSEGDVKEVSLTYVMQYEEYERHGVIELNVRASGEYDDESQKVIAQNTIQKAVDNTVNKNIDEKEAALPSNIGQKDIYYRYTKEKISWLSYVIVPAAVAVLILYRRKMKKKREQELRIKELKYDYSELIAKLTLLLGAGMTIRKAWEKMVEDYMKKKQAGGGVKIVYEEMYITDCNIKSGISEYEAYEEFGYRCNTREYLKLASLLQTNLKRGTNRLRELLCQESYDAFEQRKNIARQKGEEATTRLLIPMIMLLMVVMVIVMVPAVMNFYLT